MPPRHHYLVVVGAGFGGNGVLHGILQQQLQQKQKQEQKNDDDGVVDLKITVLDQKTKFSIGGIWQYVWSSRLLCTTTSTTTASTSSSTTATSLMTTPPEFDMEDLVFQSNNNVTLLTGAENATVLSMDTQKQQLQLTNGTLLKYDTLVLSPGVISDPTRIPGLAETSGKGVWDICNIHHVIPIKERLECLFQKAQKRATTTTTTILICVTQIPYKCPPVPFEVASLVDDLRRQYNVKDHVRIIVSLPEGFPFAGPPAEATFANLLQQQDIEFWMHHPIQQFTTVVAAEDNNDDNNNDDDGLFKTKVQFQCSTTTTDDSKNGDDTKQKELVADLVLATFPQRAPDFCQSLINAQGFIPVDLQTNLVEHHLQHSPEPAAAQVFCIGDACHTMFPKPNVPHPKSGEFAYQMGLHVANQIIARLKKETTTKEHNIMKDEALPPPKRHAKCIAECGLNDQGVVLEPDLTEALACPQEGIPTYQTPLVENASHHKWEWIEGYLQKFLGNERKVQFSLQGPNEETTTTTTTLPSKDDDDIDKQGQEHTRLASKKRKDPS